MLATDLPVCACAGLSHPSFRFGVQQGPCDRDCGAQGSNRCDFVPEHDDRRDDDYDTLQRVPDRVRHFAHPFEGVEGDFVVGVIPNAGTENPGNYFPRSCPELDGLAPNICHDRTFREQGDGKRQ